jgi:hypothetical protein
MTISKNPVSGAIIITDMIDNQLVTRVYLGYTKQEAVKRFKADSTVDSTKSFADYARYKYINK